MAIRGIAAASLLCFLLGMLCPAPADSARSNLSCCTAYNKMQLPFQRIRGYREQTSNYCHIEAIIFYTINNRQFCANAKETWVKHSLELLSTKLKRMSKILPGPEKAMMEKPKNPELSKTLEVTPETFHNKTESV
uniref:C-C motif chemokine n=1 Tax=Oryzias latipes TaxID=8090 RepID=A0A3P9MIN8_ORYLA